MRIKFGSPGRSIRKAADSVAGQGMDFVKKGTDTMGDVQRDVSRSIGKLFK